MYSILMRLHVFVSVGGIMAGTLMLNIGKLLYLFLPHFQLTLRSRTVV